MPEPQATVGFAAFARAKVEELLRHSGPTRPRDATDDAWFEAFNHYLSAEGEPLLDVSTQSQLPELFHRDLAHQLDSRTLTATATPFNKGADTQARVQSRPSNQRLADWMRATHHYHATREGCTPYEGEALKLWKQEITVGADGVRHTTITEVDTIDSSEHAVLGFNGVSGMHSAQKNLHGFFDQMTQVLGGDVATLTPIGGKKLTLYAVTYPDAHRLRYGQEIPALNADPEHYCSPMVQGFTQRVLLPWLGLKEGDAPLGVADLKHRMRRLNFFLYSYGASVGKEMRNALCDWLQTQGYEQGTIRLALAEAYALNIHPVCRLDDHHPCGQFSSLYVVSRSDQQVSARADHSGYVPQGTEPPALIPISENELMIWLEHPTQSIQFKDPDMAAQFNPAKASSAKHIEGLAGLASGHNLRIATQAYRYRAPDGSAQAYDPGYLGHSLRSVIAAAVVPRDLSQLLPIDGPDPFTLSESSQPIPSSFRLREAIQRYRAEQVGRELG